MGHSGSGKSFVAQLAVTQMALAGLHSLWIDYEDNAQGLRARLLALGLDKETIHQYVTFVSPDLMFNELAYDRWQQHIKEQQLNIGLVVIDSVGEAISACGLKPDKDEDVAQWFRSTPKRWAEMTGAAVLLIDHMKKEATPDLFAIGSQRKRAAISGASYRMDTIEEFSQHQRGKANLVVAKDRWGNYRRGDTVAVVVVEPGQGGAVSVRLVAARRGAGVAEGARTGEMASVQPEGAGEAQKAIELMESISLFLEEIGEVVSQKLVFDSIQGKREAKYKALRALEIQGNVTLTKQVGKGSPVHVELVAPFRTEPGTHYVSPAISNEGGGSNDTISYPDEQVAFDLESI